ncbi:MAG: hypothetical protein ACOCS7_03620 [Halolamina sp.]
MDTENTSLDPGPIESTTGNDRRYADRRLYPDEDVHVLGTARHGREGREYAGSIDAAVGPRLDDRSDRPLLARLRARPGGREFVVSDATERGTTWRLAKSEVVALLLTAVGVEVLALLFL